MTLLWRFFLFLICSGYACVHTCRQVLVEVKGQIQEWLFWCHLWVLLCSVDTVFFTWQTAFLTWEPQRPALLGLCNAGL